MSKRTNKVENFFDKSKMNYGNFVMIEFIGSINIGKTFENINEIVKDVPEFTFDKEYGWVKVPNPPYAEIKENQISCIIRGEITTLNWKKLSEHSLVIKVFRDTPIQPASCNCSSYRASNLLPTIKDVRRHLDVESIWKEGFRGKGIVVGIVDSGIDVIGKSEKGIFSNVIDGFSSTNSWGDKSDWNNHGNMVTYDLLGIAPDVKVYDIRITELYYPNRISQVVKAYRWAIDRFEKDGTPHILNNSWAVYDKQYDLRYAMDKNHLFTRIVVKAVDIGIKVLFAAGNCGCNCSKFLSRCKGYTGGGNSIWGANGHNSVMTIAAVNIQNNMEEYIDYSSKGPSSLDKYKPDFSAISHFKGYNKGLSVKGGGSYCDTGTSAACPVAAGVVALLLQQNGKLSQSEIKDYLTVTAESLGQGWNYHIGHGIIRPKKAFDLVKFNL